MAAALGGRKSPRREPPGSSVRGRAWPGRRRRRASGTERRGRRAAHAHGGDRNSAREEESVNRRSPTLVRERASTLTTRASRRLGQEAPFANRVASLPSTTQATPRCVHYIVYARNTNDTELSYTGVCMIYITCNPNTTSHDDQHETLHAHYVFSPWVRARSAARSSEGPRTEALKAKGPTPSGSLVSLARPRLPDPGSVPA